MDSGGPSMGPVDADDVDLYGRSPILLLFASVGRRVLQDHKLTGPQPFSASTSRQAKPISRRLTERLV